MKDIHTGEDGIRFFRGLRNALFDMESDPDADKVWINQEIDRYAKEIISLLKSSSESLPVDFAIETMNSLGISVSLLNDDDGNFAFSADGMSGVIEGKGFEGVWVVELSDWAPSVRQALQIFISKLEGT